jgi:hypothetical protein
MLAAIRSYKGKQTGQDEVPDLTIAFTVEMDTDRLGPDGAAWPEDFEANRAFYATEARRLVTHMRRTLPGGLFAALAGAFLEANAPIFIVPMPEET